ncbi:MAG: response regulator [Brevinematales bacterium]|nr:response regulator [Brevinematales bacterium]
MIKRKILLVEDEIIIASSIRKWLEELNYSVIGIAPSAEKAMVLIDEQLPELILMDIVLQGDADGIELADRIQKKYSIPIIFLTAYSDENTLERARISGPYGYLLKPVNPKDLTIAIENALYKHQEDNLRQIKTTLEYSMLDAINAGIIISDEDGNITNINKWAAIQFGYDLKKVYGKPLLEVFKRKDIQEKKEYSTARVQFPNKQTILVKYYLSSIQDENNESRGLLLFFEKNES